MKKTGFAVQMRYRKDEEWPFVLRIRGHDLWNEWLMNRSEVLQMCSAIITALESEEAKTREKASG